MESVQVECSKKLSNAQKIAYLDDVSDERMVKIYCECGNITDLDRSSMKLKKDLKKTPLCPRCRNAKIAAELDSEFYDSMSGEGAAY